MKNKKPKLPPKIYNDGPLTAAAKRVEDFSYNLYFSYVFDESVKNHQKLQDEYIEAFLDADEEKMKKINTELSIVEGAFEATAAMLDISEEHYS